MKTNNNEKVNSIKDLYSEVIVYAKSLILLYKDEYTVYTMTYSVYFNLHSKDEDLGVQV